MQRGAIFLVPAIGLIYTEDMTTTFGSEQHQFSITHNDGRTVIRRLHVPTGTTVVIADLFFTEWLASVEIIETGSSDALPPGWRGLDYNDRPIEFQRFARYWLEYADVPDVTSAVSHRHYSSEERSEIRRDVLLHVARGGSVASWYRENPDRVSRSTLYRIVGRCPAGGKRRHLFLVA